MLLASHFIDMNLRRTPLGLPTDVKPSMRKQNPAAGSFVKEAQGFHGSADSRVQVIGRCGPCLRLQTRNFSKSILTVG